MAEAKKRFENLSRIKSGTTPSSDLKMKDILAVQHMDATSGTNTLNQISVAQNMCQPIARCSGTPNDGAYVADCINFPDFSLTYTDSQSNQYYLYGLKIRVIFEDGITYGSVDSGTYPTLNINNSGAIPLLAQGLTMAQGAAVAGQSLEFTLIPYGQNGVAWDADTNIRENTSDYTIYTDGQKVFVPVNSVTSGNLHSVTSGAVYSALSESKIFTVKLVGWATVTGKTRVIKSIIAIGRKIADKTYVIPVEMDLQDGSDGAPSTFINYIEVANIQNILLVGSVYTRAPSYDIGCMAQIDGTKYYLYRVDTGARWLPSSWGSNAIIQGSVIVRIN